MSRAGARALGAAAGLLVVLPGCGWDELEALTMPAGGGGGPSDDGGFADDAAPVGASPEAGLPGDPTACSAAIPPVRQWTFDADAQGWSAYMNAGVMASLAWTGASGNPSPGALQVDVTATPADAGQPGEAWAELRAGPLGDLSHRTISAWLWLDSDTSPVFKLFVQTGSQFTWADNGSFRISPHAWTCVSMATSAPAYTNGPDYDPTNVDRLGLELDSTVPFRIFIDTVRYY